MKLTLVIFTFISMNCLRAEELVILKRPNKVKSKETRAVSRTRTVKTMSNPSLDK